MLKQASVQDISGGGIAKLHGHLVVVTRYYPRFLKRNLVHEYISDLAPPKELLHAFKAAEKEYGDHDKGFEAIDYESRFELSPEGHENLRRLSDLSESIDVYLVCHCKRGQYCHRELLMIIANRLYGAKVGSLSHPYATFRERLHRKGAEQSAP